MEHLQTMRLPLVRESGAVDIHSKRCAVFAQANPARLELTACLDRLPRFCKKMIRVRVETSRYGETDILLIGVALHFARSWVGLYDLILPVADDQSITGGFKNTSILR